MPKNKRPKTLLAKKLIQYRERVGLTQQNVSDILGVKRSTYGYYEISVCPPISILKKLANMYNVSIDELTGEYPAISATDASEETILKAAQPEVEYGATIAQCNADERELLLLYRILPQELKAQAKNDLRALTNRMD